MDNKTYDAIVTTIEELEHEGVAITFDDYVYIRIANKLLAMNVQVDEQSLCDVIADFV